ncbi:hypothetical protein Tco_1394921 [Tanacetum coccineum]
MLACVLKNGKARSADLERKRFNAASFPLKLCISFNVLGDCISATAYVFLGFALIPSEVNMYPRNFPSSTPNEHFLGFNFMLTLQRLSKVLDISIIISRSVLLLMTMSSPYASKFLPICVQKAESTNL